LGSPRIAFSLLGGEELIYNPSVEIMARYSATPAEDKKKEHCDQR
jgi:hypothetical protein